MKRHFLAAMLFAMMTILLAGCSRNEDYKTPDQLAIERQTEIMECFINKDGETLKSFFSEYVIENVPDLDTQIEAALDFLDGEIVSYDEPFSRAMGSFDRKYYGCDTLNIITDKGTEYMITFHGWLTNDKDLKRIGVYCIRVFNETKNKELPQNATESDINAIRIYIGEPE